MSTRLIGGIVMTHGDDNGLVFPPRLAPYQVVIVPITRGGNVAVEEAADHLSRRLRAAGVRTHVDGRPQLSPGFKYNEWEMRGVPIRLELGPRDLEAGTAIRDSHTRTVDSWDDFADAVSTGWARALHCGTPTCEEDIKSVTAATPRCIPLDGEPANGVCVRCGAASAYGKRVIFGRAY